MIVAEVATAPKVIAEQAKVVADRAKSAGPLKKGFQKAGLTLSGKKLGVKTMDHSSIYEGEFDQGRQDGLGRYHLHWGDLYEGEFKNSKAEGLGVAKFAGGDTYEGQWLHGSPHGRGVKRRADQTVIFEGD